MTKKDKKTVRAPQGAPFLKVRLVRSLIGYPPRPARDGAGAWA